MTPQLQPQLDPVAALAGAPPPALAPELEAHYDFVTRRIEAGKVIPFLGAGANLCGRPDGANWQQDNFLPTGAELAEYLAKDYPNLISEGSDLSRVSQYVDLFGGGEAVLFEKLRTLFAGEYVPNALHRHLASVPQTLRDRGVASPCQFIITTNYDDALERAFKDAGEPIDVVYYAASRGKGGFVHVPAEEADDDPPKKRTFVAKSYRGFALGERTVLLKIHGAVNRADELADSYVITEDHYIDYVARTNVYNLIPAALMAKMSSSHFLFLGYGMRDWNLRVILHHIWSQQPRTFTSWAIQKRPDPIDEKFWERHGVDIMDVPLETWVDGMHARIR